MSIAADGSVASGVIDLRSDTATQPTEGMRRAIAEAAVGDEQKREDPSVNELQRASRTLLGPGGGDLPADRDDGEPDRAEDPVAARRRPHRRAARARRDLRVRRPCGARRPRDARRAGRARATHARCRCAPPPRRATKAADQRAAVLALENTHNSSGGRVWRLDELDDDVETARELGLAVHLDGARLLNAAVALGVAPAEIAARLRHRHALPLEGSRLPARRAPRWLARADGRARAARSTCSAGRCGRPGSSRRPASTRSTTTSSGSPTTTRGRDAWRRARTRRGCPSISGRCETNFVQIDVAALGLARADALDSACAKAGVGLSATIHPTVIRAVTHLDVTDETSPGRSSSSPAALALRARSAV